MFLFLFWLLFMLLSFFFFFFFWGGGGVLGISHFRFLGLSGPGSRGHMVASRTMHPLSGIHGPWYMRALMFRFRICLGYPTRHITQSNLIAHIHMYMYKYTYFIRLSKPCERLIPTFLNPRLYPETSNPCGGRGGHQMVSGFGA